MHSPRELTPEILAAARADLPAALVFGNETFGLSIEEVQCCNRLMTISGNPAYFSLNLAQAVQVVSYEIFSQTGYEMSHLLPESRPATHEQVAGMTGHLERMLETIGFFRRRNRERMMRRLRALFDRAGAGSEDIDILRGIFSTVEKKLDAKQPEN